MIGTLYPSQQNFVMFEVKDNQVRRKMFFYLVMLFGFFEAKMETRGAWLLTSIVGKFITLFFPPLQPWLIQVRFGFFCIKAALRLRLALLAATFTHVGTTISQLLTFAICNFSLRCWVKIGIYPDQQMNLWPCHDFVLNLTQLIRFGGICL